MRADAKERKRRWSMYVVVRSHLTRRMGDPRPLDSPAGRVGRCGWTDPPACSELPETHDRLRKSGFGSIDRDRAVRTRWPWRIRARFADLTPSPENADPDCFIGAGEPNDPANRALASGRERALSEGCGIHGSYLRTRVGRPWLACRGDGLLAARCSGAVGVPVVAGSACPVDRGAAVEVEPARRVSNRLSSDPIEEVEHPVREQGGRSLVVRRQ